MEFSEGEGGGGVVQGSEGKNLYFFYDYLRLLKLSSKNLCYPREGEALFLSLLLVQDLI